MRPAYAVGTLLLAVLAGCCDSMDAGGVAAAQTHNSDIERAVALWKEFEMPVSPDAARWDAKSFESGEGLWDSQEGFGEDRAVAAAVQSATVGRWDFAVALQSELLGRDHPFMRPDSEWVGVPVDKSLSAATALVIATRFANELLMPDSDWRAIRDKVVRLNKHRLVKSSSGWQNRGLDDLIVELEASLRSSGTDPVQSAVDDLVNCTTNQSSSWEFKMDARYQRVRTLGMQAVPPLVDALESKRLSRAFAARMMNSPPRIVPVQHIAIELLIDIAEGDLGMQRGILTRAEVMGWYEAKRAGKVEQYLLGSVAKTVRSDDETFQIANERTFEAIAKKYPHLFEKAVRTLLDHQPPIDLYLALVHIDKAKLPTEEKRAIVTMVATVPDIDRRTNAMWYLHHLDREAYDRILIETLSAVPQSYDSVFAYYSAFATGTDNPRVWSALERTVRKVGPAMRMEMLSHLHGGYGGLEPDNFTVRSLALLRQFFDDTDHPAIPPDDPRFRYFPWGNDTTVGQVALGTAAVVLGVATESDSAKTPEQWASLRKAVDAKLGKGS